MKSSQSKRKNAHSTKWGSPTPKKTQITTQRKKEGEVSLPARKEGRQGVHIDGGGALHRKREKKEETTPF